jgi:hypothetical protein
VTSEDDVVAVLGFDLVVELRCFNQLLILDSQTQHTICYEIGGLSNIGACIRNNHMAVILIGASFEPGFRDGDVLKLAGG